MVSTPASRAVRGRTRPGRLRAVDEWVVHEAASVVAEARLVIDVGFGVSPVTVEEFAHSLHAVNAGVRVVGLERVGVQAQARGCELIAGGFDGLQGFAGAAAIVRAMNVLRGYPADEVEGIHRALCAAVSVGGLVIEGSTDVDGHVLACHLLRCAAGERVHQGLLLHTDFTRGFSPWLFRDVLPRDLRRAVLPGSTVHQRLTEWAAAADRAGPGATPAARFLSGFQAGSWLEASDWERSHGYVRLRL